MKKLINDQGRFGIYILYGILIFTLYIFFHNSYRTEYIDDAWTLSWAYDYFQDGTVTGEVFGHGENGGSVLFSRSTVLLYGGIQSLVGWQREIGYGISTSLFFLGLLFWWPALKELGFNREKRLLFFAIIILMEAYFGMAHKIRVDALNWFLLSAGFFMVLKGWFFPGGLISMIAIENHPYGISLWLYVLSFAAHQIITKKWDWKTLGLNAGIFALGAALGTVYYFALHWEWLHKLGELGGQRVGGNALFAFFWERRYAWRNLPILALFLFSSVVFISEKRFKQNPFLLFFPGMMILLTFLLPRGNYHYMVFILPSFLMITVEVFEEKKWGNLLLCGFLLFQIPQYGILFAEQWGFDSNRYLSTVENVVESFLEEEPNAILYGNSLSWFALKDHEFKALGYFRRSGVEANQYPETLVLIENPDFINGDKESRDWAENMGSNYSRDQVLKAWDELGFGQNRISVYRRLIGELE